jgi:ABC-2 family transporter
MSALAIPTRPEQDANVRPLPWRRMIWVTWRQHRFALTGVVLLLGGLAVYVWLIGRQLHHAYAAAGACHPAGSPVCSVLAGSFQSMDAQLSNGFVWQPVPALIGAFLGAPLLARELETGTFRYAWTQGFGRRRWTLAKLVLLATTVTAVAGAFSMVLSWYYRPYFAAGNQGRFLTALSPLASGLFDLRGVAFAVWTLAAFAIGALAGVLIRRAVPAIVATLAAYAGLGLAVPTLLRQHYLTALISRNVNVPGSALVLSQWWTKGGQFAFSRAPINLLERICPPPPPKAGPGNFSKSDFVGQCLSRHGYTQLTSYQPAGRFWSFQLIEGSWLLALSVILIGATLLLVHRRTA